MKHLHSLLFLLLATAGATTSFAQAGNITISGRVSSFEESLALEGVTVQVKGKKNITGTMPDGTYTLVITKEDKTLVYSLSGYETKEVPVSKSTEYNIALKRNGASFAATQNDGVIRGQTTTGKEPNTILSNQH